MKKAFKYIIVILCVTAFVSCDTEKGYEDFTIEESPVKEISGDWIVEIYRDGVLNGVEIITTSNTSENIATEMLLDDKEHGWGLLTKVSLDLENLTFSGTDLPELYFGVTVTIDGQFTKNGGTTPLGATTDAISFTAVFSDIPTEVWEYKGYKRSGFLEDQ
jgi:hypothetical protein